MRFNKQSPLDHFLGVLFERYRKAVPDVSRITDALIAGHIVTAQAGIRNDHIAFRTLGVPHLGIRSFEKIFLHCGYTKMEQYHFEEKKLNAFWYAPPSPEYPRVFMSELLVGRLSETAQAIIHSYTKHIDRDPVDALDLDSGEAIAEFLHRPLWDLPYKKVYETLLSESEYAAWVIYNRYYLNHYTISVHELNHYHSLEAFNTFIESLGIKLNTAGGKIKVSEDGLLRQSATVAPLAEALFAGGETKAIAGSYVEFAERAFLPGSTTARREGFEAGNADKIFESTYSTQTHGN